MNLTTVFAEHARATPDKPYLVVDDEVMTYGELARDTFDYARALHGLGVKKGDRVGLHMDNNTAIAPLYFACFRLGAIAMPISCFDTATEAAYSMNDCGADILIIEREMADKISKIREAVPGLRHCFVVGGDSGGPEASWEGVVTDAGPVPDIVDCEEDHPAAILYTSGSTGRPKGVTHTHGSLMHNGEGRIAAFEHGPEDGFFILSKLCHGAGLSSQLVTLGRCGGTTISTRSHAATDALPLIDRWKPAFVGVSPATLRQILEAPEFIPSVFSGTRAIYVGGDKAPLDLYELTKAKTGIALREAMGMTECGGYLNCRPNMQPKPGSAGIPIPGTEIRIVGHGDREVAQGEDGELTIRSKAVMLGYWNEPEITAATIREGWLHTGDLGHVDEDGYYFITGRIKDVIVRDTGNITPAEVEKTMIEHPGVAQCGVFGIPDGDRGEAVAAAIVIAAPESPLTEDELTAFASERLAERKVPSRWLFLDAFPITEGMGKVDRAALKKLGLKLLA